MGWLSTYQQYIAAEDGIDGKTLKEKLIEDKIVLPTEDGDYEFNEEKTDGDCWSDFLTGAGMDTSCFSPDGNKLSCTFNEDCNKDYLERQHKGVAQFSKLYPDVVFTIHSSACPGGGGIRTTVIDAQYQNGKKVKSALGQPPRPTANALEVGAYKSSD